MPLSLSDLKLLGSASMPDDNTPTNIGGAIATNRKPVFQDVAGTVQAVSSSASDVAPTVTVTYRDTAGVAQAEVKTLTGLTPVLFTANANLLLKALKSGTTVGDVAVEAQTATRTGTAQAGGANTITLDTGASAVDAFYGDFVLRITAGTGVGQIRQIKGYVGGTKVATVNWPWAVVPDATSVFRISAGFFFDRAPYEITECRRVFYNAAANAPGGGAVAYYDKLFYVNSSTGLALLTAKVALAANPSGKISFGLAASINDSGGNGGGNNRTVAPAGIVFNTTEQPVPGTDLLPGSTIGVWLKLALLDGDSALASSVDTQLSGSST